MCLKAARSRVPVLDGFRIQRFLRPLTADMIDAQVARDRDHPTTERGRIPQRAQLPPRRQEGLLHEVLDIVACRPAEQDAMHDPRVPTVEGVERRSVTRTAPPGRTAHRLAATTRARGRPDARRDRRDTSCGRTVPPGASVNGYRSVPGTGCRRRTVREPGVRGAGRHPPDARAGRCRTRQPGRAVRPACKKRRPLRTASSGGRERGDGFSRGP